jgi:hypothetical protein
MAGTIAATGVAQLQGQRKGAMAISLTDFGVTTVSQIAEGSGMEIAGSWLDFLANESMGANWAAMAIGDVYARVDSIALTSAYTATPPVWNTELQGWYDATNQYKYYAKLYKDAGGNYLQKGLYTPIRGVLRTYEGFALNTGANADQLIRFANDCRFKWDEANNRIDSDKELYLSAGGLSVLLGNLTLIAGTIVGTMTGDLTFATAKGCNGIKKITNYLYGACTQNLVFDTLNPYIPNINDSILITGAMGEGGANLMRVLNRAYRIDATTIRLYGMNHSIIPVGTQSYYDCVDGNTNEYNYSISW